MKSPQQQIWLKANFIYAAARSLAKPTQPNLVCSIFLTLCAWIGGHKEAVVC